MTSERATVDEGVAPSDPAFVVGAAAAVVAFAAVASFSWLATAAAGVGTLALVGGARRGSSAWVRAGSVALAAASVLAGLDGAPVLAVGVGAWAAFVAWDATAYALDAAAQVGAGTSTRVALGRVLDATAVGGLGVVVAAGGFIFGTTGGSALAGVAAFAALALVLALALA
jgi:hypothetical protein